MTPRLATLLLALLLLALLRAALLRAALLRAALLRAALQRPASPALLRVADLRGARPERPALVQGLPPAPAAARWGDWGVREVALLLSPTGVFGSYGECEVRGGAAFEGPCARDARCAPRHTRQQVPLAEALAAFACAGQHAYLRGAAPASFLAQLARALRLDLTNVAPYLSQAGCVTNLHWDGADGVLAQTRGEKLVALFAPGTMPRPAPESSPCFRRSYHDGQCPPGAALHVLLTPGRGLFIPGGWAHHVTSLSPRTLGCVWRLGPAP